MKASELVAALEKLGTAYTNKEKTKPAEPIVKLLKFLGGRSEATVDDIVTALKAPPKTAPKRRASAEPSAVSAQYLEQLNKPGLELDEFEKLFAGIKTLLKAPMIQVARRYSPKSKLDTKVKAQDAIREEFFRRAREEDKARQDRNSLLM
jgi:hypothetical protein